VAVSALSLHEAPGPTVAPPVGRSFNGEADQSETVVAWA
jgi:hypothetical protein